MKAGEVFSKRKMNCGRKPDQGSHDGDPENKRLKIIFF